ncbi:MAG: class I SAM-dependent methyltransferase [Acidobacteria bacterium]|nr:class I SAM-dependent methyltransferase [Acidobacteriota bacterium]
MRIVIDLDQGTVQRDAAEGSTILPIGSPEAFALISKAWLRSGWDAKYVYSFTWLGRPIIQLPEDMLRIQELIYRVKPSVLIETGVAHGGSLVFYASLFEAMGRGRVIGIDVEIRPHNRSAIERHELFDRITLVEGSSIDARVVDRAVSMVVPDDTVMVVLDANHTREHVLAELRAYGELVSIGSYIVAADGIMADLVGAPRSQPDWGWNNPKSAAAEFAAADQRFVIEEPVFAFNEGSIIERVTYWPGAFLRRVA